MWEITYNAPKGQRVNRYFWAVTTYSGLWFEDKTKTWKSNPTDSYCSHDNSVRTTKSFKRYLNKHSELKGVEVLLVSQFRGFNGEDLGLTATWKEI